MFGKRGIAPLIATMLLLSFAVSLGVVVMNFGRAQVELQAQCPISIDWKFANIGGKDDICYNTEKNELRFTLENGVNIDVAGLIVNIIGVEEAKSSNLDNIGLTKGGTYIAKVPYDKAVSGKMRQIKITPKVVMYDAEQICTEKSMIIEDAQDC